jgi:short-subunit dehydrogenase
MTPTQDHPTVRPLAVVTGASSGIGEVFARKLAARGYDLLLVARRKDRLDALSAELSSAFGTRAEALPADLARAEDLGAVEERLRSDARLEFLVNNAGFGSRQFFHEADLSVQELMHRLHVVATLRLCHAALPGMVARNRGYIVNVSSVAGFMQGPYNVSYCATKAWMNSFTEGLVLEMRTIGADVRVQALCPGFTRTEFHQAMGLSRDFAPASWWMDADEVVEAAFAGLSRRRWLVVPGWRYKLSVAALRYMPRPILHHFIARAPNVRRAQRAVPSA